MEIKPRVHGIPSDEKKRIETNFTNIRLSVQLKRIDLFQSLFKTLNLWF
jgi:hypothetical protein